VLAWFVLEFVAGVQLGGRLIGELTVAIAAVCWIWCDWESRGSPSPSRSGSSR